MQEALNNFLEELKQNPDNLAVALFGSHAKGTNRPDSDIDLLVITKTTTKRGIVKKYDREFEIVYATVEDTEKLYKRDPDNQVRFYQHAQILFDPENILNKFQQQAHTLCNQKKQPISEDKIKHVVFNFTDQLRYVKAQNQTDPANAVFMLQSMVYLTLDFYFDYHQIWKPAPKEILKTLDQINPKLAEKTRGLLLESSVEKKFILFEELVAELGVRN